MPAQRTLLMFPTTSHPNLFPKASEDKGRHRQQKTEGVLHLWPRRNHRWNRHSQVHRRRSALTWAPGRRCKCCSQSIWWPSGWSTCRFSKASMLRLHPAQQAPDHAAHHPAYNGCNNVGRCQRKDRKTSRHRQEEGAKGGRAEDHPFQQDDRGSGPVSLVGEDSQDQGKDRQRSDHAAELGGRRDQTVDGAA
jgi:hypothetical protein